MTFQKNQFLSIFKIIIASIILSIIFSPLAKFIDEDIAGIYCGGNYTVLFAILFDSFNLGCYLQGFIYFFIFWLTILAFILLEQRRAWILFVEGTIFFWIMNIIFVIFSIKMKSIEINDFSSLIIMFCAFALGYLSAFGIKKVIKKIKK